MVVCKVSMDQLHIILTLLCVTSVIFYSCGASNLNGLNLNSADAPPAAGVVFTSAQHPFTYSFKAATMMIRPREIRKREEENQDE